MIEGREYKMSPQAPSMIEQIVHGITYPFNILLLMIVQTVEGQLSTAKARWLVSELDRN